MKKLTALLFAWLVLIASPTLIIGQELYSKQFPQVPERPYIQPSETQIKAWETFQRTHPSWEIRWDRGTGAPTSILGPPIKVSGRSPEEIAHQFLKANSVLFRFKQDLSDIALDKVSTMMRAIHIILTQSYARIPIESGVCAVHMTKDNNIYLVNGRYFDDVSVATTVPSVPLMSAINIAIEDLGIDVKLRDEPTGRLTILPYGPDYLLTWKVAIPADKPSGHWIYFISATDGSILTGYNLAFVATGTGSVYDRHPDAGPVVERTLENLTNPGYELDGLYLIVYNEDGPEAYETDKEFIYDPDNTHFDEVMVWYHADNRYRDYYMENLGYPYVGYPDTTYKVEATVHKFEEWNNAAAIAPNLIWFGDGDGEVFNDLAKENDVIYHEYQHLITFQLTYDGLVGTREDTDQEDAMCEAFSDYPAASFDDSPLIGEWIVPGPGSLRDLDNGFTMSDWGGEGDPLQNYHQGSQIFSGALWDLRQEFGQDIADILDFEGLCNLTQPHPDFIDGRNAIIAADYARYSGSHVSTIFSVFASREILITPSVPTGLCGVYFPPDHGGPKVHLEWNRNPTEELVDKYWLERAVESGGFGAVNKNIPDPGSGYTVTYDDWVYEQQEAEYLRYRIKAHNDVGWGPFCTPIIVELGEDPLKSSGTESIPTKLKLDPNYPNPFNPTTQIKFGLPTTSHVRLQIMNIRGQTVRVLVDEERPAGWYIVTWDSKNESGRDVASGIYLYIIEADNKKILKKMTIIR